MNLPWLSSFTGFAQILLPESCLPLNLNCGNSYGFPWWFHGKNLGKTSKTRKPWQIHVDVWQN